MRDIGWLAVPSYGNVSGNLFNRYIWMNLSSDGSRANAVYRHAVRSGLQSQYLGQHDDRCFGRSVGTSAGVGHQSADRPDIHDSARPLPFHMRQRQLAAKHRAVDIHSKCLFPGLERMVFNEFQGMHGRIVAEEIQTPIHVD